MSTKSGSRRTSRKGAKPAVAESAAAATPVAAATTTTTLPAYCKSLEDPKILKAELALWFSDLGRAAVASPARQLEFESELSRKFYLEVLPEQYAEHFPLGVLGIGMYICKTMPSLKKYVCNACVSFTAIRGGDALVQEAQAEWPTMWRDAFCKLCLNLCLLLMCEKLEDVNSVHAPPYVLRPDSPGVHLVSDNIFFSLKDHPHVWNSLCRRLGLGCDGGGENSAELLSREVLYECLNRWMKKSLRYATYLAGQMAQQATAAGGYITDKKKRRVKSFAEIRQLAYNDSEFQGNDRLHGLALDVLARMMSTLGLETLHAAAVARETSVRAVYSHSSGSSSSSQAKNILLFLGVSGEELGKGGRTAEQFSSRDFAPELWFTLVQL